MSNAATGIAWHHSAAPTQTTKLILIKIADMAGDGGAWPSMETLANAAMVTKDAARKAVRQLEQLGEIKTHLNEGGGIRTQKHMRTNVYEFLLTCPWYCDGSAAHRDLRDDRNWERRPPHWAQIVTANTGETPQPQELPPAPGTGGPQPQELPNHKHNHQTYGDTSSTVTYQHADAREDAAGADGKSESYADWHPGQKIAQAAKQVRASNKVKRPDLSKPINPIGKVPPAPEYPRFEPDPPRQPPEPRTPEQEAAVQHASQLVCPEGFGDRPTTRHHWFPGTLTGCARCGIEASHLVRRALTDLEHTA